MRQLILGPHALAIFSARREAVLLISFPAPKSRKPAPSASAHAKRMSLLLRARALPAGTCHSRRLRSATLPQTPPCSCRRHVAPGKPPLTCFLSPRSTFFLMRLFQIIFAIFSNLRFLVFYHLNHPHIPTPIRPRLRPSSAYKYTYAHTPHAHTPPYSAL